MGQTNLINLRQLLNLRSVQHPQRQGYHLQILATSRRADVPRSCPNIIYDRPLQPWYEEVCALVDDLFLHTREAVEDDGARATLDVVERGLQDRGADGGGYDPAEEGGRYRGHGLRVLVRLGLVGFGGTVVSWCGGKQKWMMLPRGVRAYAANDGCDWV